MSGSPYMTAREAAEYVRKTPKAFDEWVRRRGIPVAGCAGRLRLFTTATLDRVLRLDAMKRLQGAG